MVTGARHAEKKTILCREASQKIKHWSAGDTGWHTVLRHISVNKKIKLKWQSYSPVTAIEFLRSGVESAAWHVDGRVRIQCKQHKSMDLVCLVPTMQVLKMFFLAQIRFSRTRTQPEPRWPCVHFYRNVPERMHTKLPVENGGLCNLRLQKQNLLNQ